MYLKVVLTDTSPYLQAQMVSLLFLVQFEDQVMDLRLPILLFLTPTVSSNVDRVPRPEVSMVHYCVLRLRGIDSVSPWGKARFFLRHLKYEQFCGVGGLGSFKPKM